MIDKTSTEQPSIYLTFDDGPDPRFTPRLLDLLDSYQIHATFFVLGRACERFPDVLRRIDRSGHTVGNHTYNHYHPWSIAPRRARQEVRQTYDVIGDICGEPPRFFRPPHGRLRPCMVEEAASLGMETVLWDRSAMDWGIMAGTKRIRRRLNRTKVGEIILCHDAPLRKNHPEMMLAVLPGFIRDCQRRELRFAGLLGVGGNRALGIGGNRSGQHWRTGFRDSP